MLADRQVAFHYSLRVIKRIRGIDQSSSVSSCPYECLLRGFT
jgi:hypothetical protein